MQETRAIEAAAKGQASVQKGIEGVRLSQQEARAAGEKLLGDEITFELPSGGKMRADSLTETSDQALKIREAKNGPNARLTERQREMQDVVQTGGTVIPRGQKAADAGLSVGVPTRIDEYEVDWFDFDK
jgi:hypothetical protein